MALDTPNPLYIYCQDAWKMVRDCVSGSRAVKKGGARYLPALHEQDAMDYEDMLKRALFFNATGRTLQAFQGFVFRKNPDFEIAIPIIDRAMKPFMDDCTMAGKSFYDYCKLVLHDLLSVGRAGTWIDWDSPANENRPFIVHYDTEDILDWSYIRVGAQTVLGKVVLREVNVESAQEKLTTEDANQQPYQTNTERYRVAQLIQDGNGDWYVYVTKWRRETTGKGGTKNAITRMVLDSEYTPTRRSFPLNRIPFVFHNTNGDNGDPNVIPLEDFANVNISHYQTSADLEGARHIAGQPTPYAIGFGDDEEFYLGSSQAWVTNNPNAKAGFLELSGTSLNALEKAIDQKEKQMASLGARMLESQISSRGAEAFETVQIRQSGETSALTEITIAATQTLSKVMRWVAWWLATEDSPEDFSDKVYVELNTDFTYGMIDPAVMTAVWQMYLGGGISFDTLFYNLQKGQIIPSEKDIEEEKTAIENSPNKLPTGTQPPGPGTSQIPPKTPPAKKKPARPGFQKKAKKGQGTGSAENPQQMSNQ